ncbi:flavin reductase family protein [Bifidobacterium aquikefiricola]|uniref:Flavin reductase family protein n=2 Tax=Bifidobacterium TaxID=1678 RepID=A0AB39U800_9BIFI
MNMKSSGTHVVVHPGMLYYGNTVVLLSTTNPDGSTNIAPMSSSWALGDTIVLGMGLGSRTAENLAARGQAVLSLPGPELFAQVERLGDMTGVDHARSQHGHGSMRVRDKFSAVGLTPEPCDLVSCEGVRECRLQIEVKVVHCEEDVGHGFLLVQAHVLRVHADPAIVVAGTSHIDPTAWKPLIYNFRHYHTLAPQIGESAITETPTAAR